MSPREKITNYFKSVRESDIVYENGCYIFPIEVFGIRIRIDGRFLEEYTMEDIISMERKLLAIDDEKLNSLRKFMIWRY